jgi:hypothetical protein
VGARNRHVVLTESRPARALTVGHMNNTTQALFRSGGNRLVILALVAIGVLSVPVFCTRFLNDMDYYTLVSDKLLRGGVLYRNALDTKPPLVFFHYATIFRLFGRGNLAAVKVVTMLWLGLSATIMVALRKQLFPSSIRPEMAAALFVLASFSGWGEDFLATNTEILSNLFVLLGVWLMVTNDFNDRWTRLLGAGASIGTAFLYRYQAGAALAAYALTMAASPANFERPLRRLSLLVVGWLIPAGLFVIYYFWIDGLSDLGLLLRYQSYYLRPHDLYWSQVFAQFAVVIVSLAPFWVLSGWQVVVMSRKGTLDRRDLFLLSFLLSSAWPFFVGSHYFPHYMVQAIPALVLLTQERLTCLARESLKSQRAVVALRYARVHIIINVVAFSVVNTVYYARLPGDAPVPDFARFVHEHTGPHDSVFLWTARFHILFEVDRSYATRFLSNEFLTGRLYVSRNRLPDATADAARAAAIPELWPVLLGDLQTEKPRLIVDDAPGRSHFGVDQYPALSAFVHKYYEPSQVIDGFQLYLRKAG